MQFVQKLIFCIISKKVKWLIKQMLVETQFCFTSFAFMKTQLLRNYVAGTSIINYLFTQNICQIVFYHFATRVFLGNASF